jgi:hypothetical protein
MTVAGQTSTQKLIVIGDPASHAALAEMQERYRIIESVLHELSQVDLALNRLGAMHAQLEALQQVTKGSPDEHAVKTEIEAFEKKMKTLEDAITSNAGAEESTLRVPDQIHEKLLALDGLLEGEDDVPTTAVMEQKKLVDGEYSFAIEKFNEFFAGDAKAFSGSMTARKLTGLVIGDPVKP